MKCCCLFPADEISREKLKKAAPEVEFTWAYDLNESYFVRQPYQTQYKEALLSSEIIIGAPPAELVGQMKSPGLLQLAMAGTEPYSLPGVLPEGIKLCNASGAFGKAISEHMLAATLMLQKKLHLYRDDMPSGAWLDRGIVTSPTSLQVLCVGLGDIGSRYAKLMHLLGSRVDGIRRVGKDKPDWVETVFGPEDLDRILPDYDVVALSLPGNQATAGLFSAQRLARMKPGSLLLNVGRGTAVDGLALADALREGKIGGAALDVTEPEPLPQDHPLWKEKNCLITPHVSGFYHLRDTYDAIVDISCENIRRYLDGRPLLTPVDPRTGYRVTQQYT